MPIGTGFSTSGATPYLTGALQKINSGGTPVANALNSLATNPNGLTGGALPKNTPNIFSSVGNTLGSAFKTPATGSKSLTQDPPGAFGGLFNSPSPISSPLTSGLLGTAPKSATPLKSTKITNADGSEVTHTYHAPDTTSTETATPTQTTPPATSAVPPQTATPPTPVTAPAVSTGNTNGTTFPGLVGEATKAYGQAGNVNQAIGQAESDAENNPNYIGGTGTGISAEIARNYGLIGQNAITRATGLAGLASTVAPTVGQQGQTQYSPLSAGNNNGSVSLTGVTATDVNNLSTAVANGTIDYSSALSQLSSYGPAVQNQLLPAIQKLNPNFSVNASNASSATTATGQKLQTQSVAANQALDTLSQQFSQLGNTTGSTGFQPLNSLEQNISNLFGNDAVSKYTTTLQEARAKISGVLAASGGVTPTTADEMAKTYLPDGMTPSQLPAKIDAAKTLIKQSVDAFTKSGNQNTNANTNDNADIYSF